MAQAHGFIECMSLLLEYESYEPLSRPGEEEEKEEEKRVREISHDAETGSWVAYTTSEGRMYYHNTITGESCWSREEERLDTVHPHPGTGSSHHRSRCSSSQKYCEERKRQRRKRREQKRLSLLHSSSHESNYLLPPPPTTTITLPLSHTN